MWEETKTFSLESPAVSPHKQNRDSTTPFHFVELWKKNMNAIDHSPEEINEETSRRGDSSSQGMRVTFIHERKKPPMRGEDETTKMRDWGFHHEVITGESCSSPTRNKRIVRSITG
ncbi:MAG: hypothetical protein MR455_02115 [Prevotella sp.]|nr:hypothetical protein [Prevotella sp.]MDY2634433.1 hypothetical protein [Prevotella sp.]